MLRLAAVLLAAGNSKRYGANKLTVQINGQMMISHAIQAINENRDNISKVIVVTQYENIVKIAEDNGFEVIVNSSPDLGQTYSIRLGLSQCLDFDGCIFFVCDQPWISCDSIKRLISMWSHNPDKIVACAFECKLGNPVIFPQKLYSQLLALRGDTGGRSVIARNADVLLTSPIFNEKEIEDVDYKRPY